MTTTMLIARLLLPVFVLVTLTAFISPRWYKEIVKEIMRNPALIYIVSILNVVGGTAIILYHNTWNQDLSTLITIIGWLAAIKGALYILFPATTMRAISGWANSTGFIYGAAILTAIMSVGLYSLGYMA